MVVATKELFMKKHTRNSSQPNSPNLSKLRRVVGIHSCSEVINVRPHAIQEIWLQQGWERASQLQNFANFAKKKKLSLKTVALKKLDEMSWGHQGVGIFVNESPQVDWSTLESDGPQRVVLLDGIEDPQNLGSMLRTSWLMGVSAVFTPKDRAAGLTPAVCKVASGGAEHVPIEASNNFTSIIKKLKDLGFWVYSLAEGGEQNVYQVDLPEKVAWVVGSEDKGVRKATMKESDAVISIPQVETGSSYNASVALAIALSETIRSTDYPKNRT